MDQTDQPPPAPAAFLHHHGRTGEAIALGLGNAALNVLTLTLWRFWAKTRVRRFLWGGTTAWGDPVEYTGTGKELFLGFLMILVAVFLPLTAAFSFIQVMAVGSPEVGVLLLPLQGLVLFLVAAGLYRARRYQLSRTTWRGIRGGQGGSAWRYALRWLAVMAATAASLGWAWPWGEVMLARYRWNHTTFGDQSFRCDATAAPIYGRFATLWLLGFAASAGLGLWVQSLPIPASEGEMALHGLMVAGTYAAVLTLVLAVPYALYRAAFHRHVVSCTRFGEARLSAPFSTWSMVRLVLGNGLITLLSFGILRPWAALRSFRFACGTLRISGEPDFDAIRQGTARRPRTGEGLIAVLDGAGDF